MLFIDDLLDEMYDVMEKKQHRAEHPPMGKQLNALNTMALLRSQRPMAVLLRAGYPQGNVGTDH